MFKLSPIIFLLGLSLALASSLGKLDPELERSLLDGESPNIIISFAERNSAVVSSIESKSFASRAQRISSLKGALEALTEKSQARVKSFLTGSSVEFKSFWISNQIYVKAAGEELIEALSNFPEVAKITKERIIPFDPIIKGKRVERNAQAEVEWGIERVRAEEAWKITNGTGVVVANIDSGVRYTHEALRGQWREDYGWFDPLLGTEFPWDNDSHGSHTMGTIVGTHGIGVAPGAKWVACSDCSSEGCAGQSEASLIACGQWMVCPTLANGSNPDCSKAPNVVSNSWGGREPPFFEDITEAWIAAGIVPVFSVGNSGSACATVRSPGDYRRVIGVGSTNVEDFISDYSSVGPGPNGRIKPELSAPGEDVRSSVPDSDTAYDVYSGTSMAAPHVAGVTALLLSVNPNLSFAEVRQALIDGVDHDLVARNVSCGGIRDGDFPNNHFGYGMVNAKNVVERAKKNY